MFGRTPSLRPALKPSGDLLDEAPRWFRGVCHFDWSEDDRQRESCEHDGQVGAAAHVASGACLAGGVTVGAGAFVGAGATVIQGIRIGAAAFVAAGAVVVRDVPENALVAGVPARILKRLSP